jgi:hypothetical protein
MVAAGNGLTATHGSSSSIYLPELPQLACHLSSEAGEFLARGTALVTGDEANGFQATVQGLEPVGPVLLSIFGNGARRFRLALSGGVAVPVELVASRWLDGSRRVCFFRSV